MIYHQLRCFKDKPYLKISSLSICYSEIQKFNDIPEIELVMLWNLAPGSYEEAVTLIPQLKDRPEEAINHMIEFLNKNKS